MLAVNIKDIVRRRFPDKSKADVIALAAEMDEAYDEGMSEILCWPNPDRTTESIQAATDELREKIFDQFFSSSLDEELDVEADNAAYAKRLSEDAPVLDEDDDDEDADADADGDRVEQR